MKKIMMLFVGFFFVGAAGLHAQPPAAIQLANHIAQKMKDTLGMTSQQKTQVYDINISLHNQKMAVRQQYNHPDSIRVHTQLVESTRDSLYHTIITGTMYSLYLQKKRNLVSAN